MDCVGNIQKMLSHGSATPIYFWQREEAKNSQNITYRLVATAQARKFEQMKLDEPQREATEKLKSWREEKEHGIAEAEALKGLSDDELNGLLQGRPLVKSVTPKIVAAMQKDYDALCQRLRSLGDDRVFPPFQMTAKEITLLVVTQSTAFRTSPDMVPTYYLSMLPGRIGPNEVVTGGMNLSGYISDKEAKEALLPEETDKAPVFDLAPLLNKPEVAEAQRNDLGFVLSVLGEVSGKNFYTEFFYDKYGNTPVLSKYKGTLSQLVNDICRRRRLITQVQGDDVVLWNQNWATQRRKDISEIVLAPWRKILSERKVTSADYVALASRLSWEQMDLTLPYALPMFKPVQEAEYRDMLLASTLSPQEQAVLRSREAVPAIRLNAQAQAAIRQMYFGPTPPFQLPTRSELPRDGLARVRVSSINNSTIDGGEYRPLYSVVLQEVAP